MVTTTIVDIEPARYGRRTEEYKVGRPFLISWKYWYFQIEEYYLKTSPAYEKSGTREPRQYEQSSEQYSHSSKQQNFGENRENIDSPVDSSPIDVVRNVIDQFETKIGNKTRTYPLEQLRSVSRVDMNDNNSKFQEKIILHQRSESQPIERVVPISPLPPVKHSSEKQTGLVQIYEELKTISVKQTDKPVTLSPVPVSQEISLEETSFSPQPAITPLPTADFVEESSRTAFVEEVIGKKDVTEKLVLQYVQEAEHTKETEGISDKKLEYVTDKKVEAASPVQEIIEGGPKENLTKEYSQNSIDRDYNIKTYEEWTTTSRRRDKSEPPKTVCSILLEKWI